MTWPFLILIAAAGIGWTVAIYQAGSRRGRELQEADSETELNLLRWMLQETRAELLRMEPVRHAKARARFEARLGRRER